MNADLSGALEKMLGARVTACHGVAGGDINQAFRVELSDARRVFVKAKASAPAQFFELEARGLEWLRAAEAVSVPRVLGVGKCASLGFLALEWVSVGEKGSSFDEDFGRALAVLHCCSPASFGLERDNYIGSLVQSNQRCLGFPEFYASRRLIPQFELAASKGLFDPSTRERFDSLIQGLPSLLGEPEAPARLHGDLWSGNCLCGSDGRAWLIDPAVYGGHREMDLAMMRLFGGFSERVFHAYAERYPLSCGYRERVELMQLYPILVHVNLFGGSYVASARRVIERYACRTKR
jgi:fructosamine-3-kinase